MTKLLISEETPDGYKLEDILKIVREDILVRCTRLSADGSSVVLLEAGASDWHPLIHIPAGVLHLLRNPSVSWQYATDPDERTSGRAINWPRGKGEIFTAATCEWVMGLTRRDRQVEQVTRNVLDRYCR